MTSVSCDLSDASPDTITRNDAGSFLTDGFVVGMSVRVSLAATAGNNNPRGPGYVITIITALVMTFANGTLSGTDAADTITITAGAAYRSTVDNTIWLFDTQNIADDAVSGGIDLETVNFSQLLITFEATLDTGGSIKRRQTLVINGAQLAQSNDLYDSAIFIDTTGLGVSGTAFPIGTFTDPVDNVGDARLIADSLNIRKYQIRGPITLDAGHTQWSFLGVSSVLSDSVALDGFDVTDSAFERLTVSGAAGGAIPKNLAMDQVQMSAITGFDGVAVNSGILTSFGLAANGSVILDNTNIITTNAVIDGNGASSILWNQAAGLFSIINLTAGSELNIAFAVAVMILDNTNTGGNLRIGGLATIFNTSAMTIVFFQTLDRLQIGLGVWDVPKIFSTDLGEFGGHVGSLGTPATTADAVWDEPTSGHDTANTFGEQVLNKLLTVAKFLGLK